MALSTLIRGVSKGNYLIRNKRFDGIAHRFPLFSTIDNTKNQSSPNENPLASITFDEHFNSTSIADIHDVRFGGFVDLDTNDVQKFIPEGLAGELNDEFEFTGRKSWMIRDSAKFLFRVIEEFENNNKGQESAGASKSNNVNQGLSSRITVPGLTDRPEWPEAKVQGYYFGSEVNPVGRPTLDHNYMHNKLKGKLLESSDSTGYDNVSGEGSEVERMIEALKMKNSPIPTKFMLTGDNKVYNYDTHLKAPFSNLKSSLCIYYWWYTSFKYIIFAVIL